MHVCCTVDFMSIFEWLWSPWCSQHSDEKCMWHRREEKNNPAWIAAGENNNNGNNSKLEKPNKQLIKWIWLATRWVVLFIYLALFLSLFCHCSHRTSNVFRFFAVHLLLVQNSFSLHLFRPVRFRKRLNIYLYQRRLTHSIRLVCMPLRYTQPTSQPKPKPFDRYVNWTIRHTTSPV